MFAHGVEGLVILSRHATAKSMEHQGEESLVFSGVEVEVQVVAEEADMADMGKAQMWRNKDMGRCWLGKSVWG